MKYYLVTTDHLTDKLLFRDDGDFKAGMNFTPLIALALDVGIMAFILMSNLVHYILACMNKAAALAFITRFKSLYGGYYCRKYGVKDFLRHVQIDIRELSGEDEILEKGVAYVLMNSVAAKITLNASGYQWGSGMCYFNRTALNGTPIGSISWRKRCSILKSRQQVKPEWVLTGEGYIDPRSYICVKMVEKLYRTPTRMQYFLNNSSKAKKRLESSAGLPAFRDQVILDGLNDLCSTLFGKQRPEELTQEEKAELLKQLRRRFSSDINQLCRVTGFSPDEAGKMLDSI